MVDETVRIYTYSDSGPYGWWSKCPEGWTKVAHSGFGETPIYVVPKKLWEQYAEADKLRDAAEAAINLYIEEHGG